MPRMRSGLVVLLVSVSMGTVLSRSAADPDPIPQILAKARRDLVDLRFAAAAATLAELLETAPKHAVAPEARVLHGRALLLDRRPQDAVIALSDAVGQIPAASPWHMKSRAVLARAVLATGDGPRATEMTGALATELSGVARCRRLAARFRELGEEFFAPKPKKDDPLAAPPTPNYERAATFFAEAAAVLDMSPERADFQLRLGECHFRRNDFTGAARVGRAVLHDWKPRIAAGGAVDDTTGIVPDDDKNIAEARRVRARARFLVGRAELRAGRQDAARAVLEELEASPGKADEIFAVVGELLGRTYGLPKPATDAELEAGLRHWRAFITANPRHPRAEVCRRETVDALAHRGRNVEAEQAARDYLTRHEATAAAPTVMFRIAELRERRGDFAGAREALRQFQGTFPDDPRRPAAQTKIPTLYLAEARIASKGKDLDAARRSYEEFLDKHPTHPKAGEAAVAIGSLNLMQRDLEAAARTWRTATERYRTSDPNLAATAGYRLGLLLENETKDLAAAVERYRLVAKSFPNTSAAHRANGRLATMETVELELSAPRILRTDEQAVVRLVTRNVKDVSFRVHRVAAESYFRSKHSNRGFEDLDIDLVRPTAAWTTTSEDYEPYRRDSRDVAIRVDVDGKSGVGAGVYVVSADDGTRKVTVAVFVSDLQIIVKESARQVFCFAEDVRLREPAAGVEILVSNGVRLVAEGKTGADGVFVTDVAPDSQRRVFARREGHVAPGCLGRTPSDAAFGYTTKGRIVTDRPIYRPGDEVRLRGLVRGVEKGRYVVPAAKTKAVVRVRSATGAVIRSEVVELTAHGSFSTAFSLDEASSLGDYQAIVDYLEQSFVATFRVDDFRKPEYLVRFDTTPATREGIEPGENVEMTGVVTDFIGLPVANARLDWEVFRRAFRFDGRSLDSDAWAMGARDKKARRSPTANAHEQGATTTDDAGRFRFPLTTRPGPDQTYVVRAVVIGDDRTPWEGWSEVHATLEGFFGLVRPDRKTYRKGDVLEADVVTVGPALGALTRSGVLRLLVRENDGADLREIARTVVTTGLDGRGRGRLEIPEAGDVVVRYEAAGRRGRTTGVDAVVRVTAESFASRKDVRISADRRLYREGEDIVAYLESPMTSAPILVTFEADRVIDYRIFRVDSLSRRVELAALADYAPNAYLCATLVHDGELRESRDEIAVVRYLDVTVSTVMTKFRPGDEVELEVRTRDQNGKPVAAELGLAVVDRAVLALDRAARPDIRSVFYDAKRRHAVASTASCQFAYRGQTRMIDRDVLALEREKSKRAILEALRERQVDEVFELESLNDKIAELEDEDLTPSNEAIGLGGGAGGSFGMRAGGRRKNAMPVRAAYANVDHKAVPAQKPLAGERLKDRSIRAKWNPTSDGITLPVRRRFLDVAHFDAHVVTDKNGAATVRFRLPDNLTAWRVNAEGATSSTHVGRGRAELRVEKPLEVDIAGPRFLRSGDVGSYRVVATNRRDEDARGTVRSMVETPKHIGAVDWARMFEVRPRSRAFEESELRGADVGEGRVRVEWRTKHGGDAMEQSIPVAPFGEPMAVGGDGQLDEAVVFDFEIEGDVVPGSMQAVLALSRGCHDDLIDAVVWLSEYPYACLEQSIHRFRPAVRLLEAFEKTGVPAPFRPKEIRRRVERGLLRVVESQRSDGGFGWWRRGGVDPWLTAMALETLDRGRRIVPSPAVNVALAKAERAATTLLRNSTTPVDAKASLLRVLALRGKAPQPVMNALARRPDSLSVPGLAWLTMAASSMKRDVQAAELERRLSARRRNASSAAKRGRGCEFVREDTEVSAWVLRALLARGRSGQVVDDLAQSIRRAKRGPAFGSTKATGAVVEALAEYVERHEGRVGVGRVDVALDDKIVTSVTFDAETAGSRLVALPIDATKPGRRRLRLAASNITGRWALKVGWTRPVDRADAIAARSGTLEVQRVIGRFVPIADRAKIIADGHTVVRERSRPRRPEVRSLAETEAGQRYTITLDLTGARDHRYVLLEDPIPAGFEVVEDSATGSFVHVERRADRMAFFFDRLKKDTTTRVQYTVYAAYPGRYRTPPASATEMYDPRHRGTSSGTAIVIHPEGATLAVREADAVTPDYRYASGRRAMDDGRFRMAIDSFSPLLELDLRDDIRGEVLEALVRANLALGDAAVAVRLNDRLVLEDAKASGFSTSDILLLGHAYRTTGDAERARGFYHQVISLAFATEQRYVEALNDLDRADAANEALVELCRRHPDRPEILDEWFDAAERWFETHQSRFADRDDLPDLVMYMSARGYRDMREVMSHHPLHPRTEFVWADEVERLHEHGLARESRGAARRFLERYPKSSLADDVLAVAMNEAFAAGDYDDASKGARRLIDEKWPKSRRQLDEASAASEASEHRPGAEYTLGRIAHVRGDLARAVEHYGRVARHFDDAAQSYAYLTEESLSLPAVVTTRPGTASIPIRVKNLKRVRAEVYPLDLSLVFAARKSLAAINDVELTGIRPERTIEVDTTTKAKPLTEATVDLSFEVKTGAYLVVARSGERTATTILVATDLQVELQRRGGSLRVHVRDGNDRPVADATVMVGDGNGIVARVTTDARGLAIVGKVNDKVTVLVAKTTSYAIAEE